MNMINESRIICCDYYSTLVMLDKPFDTLKDWVNNYLACHYPHVDGNRFFSRFNRYRATMLTNTAFKRGIDLLVECFEHTCIAYDIPYFSEEIIPVIDGIFTSPQAYPDAYEFLHKARMSHRVGLLTNADNYLLYKSIEKNKFDFDYVITSEDVKANKPDRKIFEYAMNYLEVGSKDIIMIGDSQVDDIMGAEQLGIATVWVNRSNEKLKDGIKPPDAEVTSLIGAFEYLSAFEKGSL